jgi:hypothetical protein
LLGYLVCTVTIGTDGLGPGRSEVLFGNLVFLVTIQAHRFDAAALEGYIGPCRADILIVRVASAQAMTFDASDFCRQMIFAQLLFDERHVTDIAGGIGPEGVSPIGP